MKRRAPHTGFTLMELLLAALVFSVLLGALYSVFLGAFKLRNQVNAQLDQTTPRNRIMEILKRDLKAMVPPGGKYADSMLGENIESSSVHQDRLEFYTSSGRVVEDEDEPWCDIQYVEYELAEDETKSSSREKSYQLMRNVRRNLLAAVEEDPAETPVLSGVASLEFRFYDGESWVDSWDSTTNDDELPLAIMAQIDFAQNEQEDLAPQPPLVVICELAVQTQNSLEDSGNSEEGNGNNATE
ncbi:prepilin-type N-terminal cleavage/methylation domain-containing protein [Candidatus Sumerlaeota bacterium]|nr:prepilin-type N-terminal cleavage/methylation domain-containing protein [Candidatus Sumerlaeota bacterium]